MTQNDTRLKEINDLCRVTTFILDYMANLSGDNTIYSIVKNKLADECSNENLRNVKYINKDVINWAEQLGIKDKIELSKKIKKNYGLVFEDLFTIGRKTINKVIKKGRIQTDDEYRLLQDRLDSLCEDDDLVGEAKQLDKLLSEYQPIK